MKVFVYDKKSSKSIACITKVICVKKDQTNIIFITDRGDTYKFDDSSYTYRLFSKVDVSKDYFLPKDKEELISYYQDNNYTCKQTGDE